MYQEYDRPRRWFIGMLVRRLVCVSVDQSGWVESTHHIKFDVPYAPDHAQVLATPLVMCGNVDEQSNRSHQLVTWW